MVNFPCGLCTFFSFFDGFDVFLMVMGDSFHFFDGILSYLFFPLKRFWAKVTCDLALKAELGSFSSKPLQEIMRSSMHGRD